MDWNNNGNEIKPYLRNYLPISVEYECDDAKVWRWFCTRGLGGEGARVFGERTRHQMLNGAKRESFLPTPVPATRVVSLFSTIGRVAFNVPHTYMRNKTFLQTCDVFSSFGTNTTPFMFGEWRPCANGVESWVIVSLMQNFCLFDSRRI